MIFIDLNVTRMKDGETHGRNQTTVICDRWNPERLREGEGEYHK